MVISPLFVTYDQSRGAIALADPSDKIGLRLIHDQRFDEARYWALAQFAGDDLTLSRFLCELAMFCELYGKPTEAQHLLLEALEKGDPSRPPFSSVLSVALGHSLATRDAGFAEKVLRRIEPTCEPSVTVELGLGAPARSLCLPIDVALPLAEDIAANVILVCFASDHDAANSQGASSPLQCLIELGIYLEAVAARAGGQDKTTLERMPLAEIALAVLVELAHQARREKSQQRLAELRSSIEVLLEGFGQPIEAYPPSLASYTNRIVGPPKNAKDKVRSEMKRLLLRIPVLHRLAVQLREMIR